MQEVVLVGLSRYSLRALAVLEQEREEEEAEVAFGILAVSAEDSHQVESQAEVAF